MSYHAPFSAIIVPSVWAAESSARQITALWMFLSFPHLAWREVYEHSNNCAMIEKLANKLIVWLINPLIIQLID